MPAYHAGSGNYYEKAAKTDIYFRLINLRLSESALMKNVPADAGRDIVPGTRGIAKTTSRRRWPSKNFQTEVLGVTGNDAHMRYKG